MILYHKQKQVQVSLWRLVQENNKGKKRKKHFAKKGRQVFLLVEVSPGGEKDSWQQMV